MATYVGLSGKNLKRNVCGKNWSLNFVILGLPGPDQNPESCLHALLCCLGIKQELNPHIPQGGTSDCSVLQDQRLKNEMFVPVEKLSFHHSTCVRDAQKVGHAGTGFIMRLTNSFPFGN